MADIFVSYARGNREPTEQFVDLLEAQGWSVWWDRDIGPGSTFSRVIEREIADAKCVIVLWTSASVASDWVNAEATEGLQRQVLIPVKLEDVNVPLIFRQTQTANLTGWPTNHAESEVKSLLAAISNIISQPVTNPEFNALPHRADASFNPRLAVAIVVAFLLLAASGVYLLAPQDGSPAQAGVESPSNATNESAPPPLDETPLLTVFPFENMSRDISVEVANDLVATGSVRVLSSAESEPPAEQTQLSLRGFQRDGQLVISLFDEREQRTRISFEVSLEDKPIYGAAREVVRRVTRELGSSIDDVRETVSDEIYLEYLEAKSDARLHMTNQMRVAHVEQLQSIVERAPRFVEALAELCSAAIDVYQGSGDATQFNLAEKHCLRAARLENENPWVQIALGQLYREAGQLEDAEASYENARSVSPYMTGAIVGLAHVSAARGDMEKAVALMLDAQRLEPRNWKFYHTLGNLYFRRGQFSDAALEYEAAADRVRNPTRILNDLGSAYFMLERFDEAVRNWSRLAEIEPGFEVLSNLGSAYYFDSNFDAALNAYRRAIEINNNDYRMWLNCGEAAFHARAADSESCYRKSIDLARAQWSINPDDSSVLSALALAHASVGESSRASEYIQQALLAGGNNIYVLYDVAAAYSRLGNKEEMQRVLKRMQQNGYAESLIRKDANFK